jgi:glycosyltransferase involved in cell wall biosynthesis
MRVYYVSSGLAGCYLVRCLLPLQANGWDGDTTSIVPHTKTPENKATAAINADIVVFHRPESPDKLKLARHLKSLGKKIVFDNDDTYKDDNSVKLNAYMTEERVKFGLNKINEVVDTFIAEADLVTTSTEFLADEYRKLNPNVVVLPNMIDPFYFDEPLRNEGDKVRIGITGSVGLSSDLDVLFPIFKHYEKDPRVQLVFFSLNPNPEKLVKEIYSDEYKILNSLNVEWIPLVPVNEYYETLNNAKLDIQIIPRQDNYFNRCKSNIKFLESSMLEIPVIGQGFSDNLSPYQATPEDSKHMLIAHDFYDWVQHIETLIESKEKRLEMGKNARKYVEKNYDINKKAHLWEDAYRKIYDVSKM